MGTRLLTSPPLFSGLHATFRAGGLHPAEVSPTVNGRQNPQRSQLMTSKFKEVVV